MISKGDALPAHDLVHTDPSKTLRSRLLKLHKIREWIGHGFHYRFSIDAFLLMADKIVGEGLWIDRNGRSAVATDYPLRALSTSSSANITQIGLFSSFGCVTVYSKSQLAHRLLSLGATFHLFLT